MVKTTQPSDIDPDSSSEICAKSVQGGMSAQRSEQIVAWNALADAMIKVVKTIKKNEQRQAEMKKHIRLVALVVIAAVVCGMMGGAYVARTVLEQVQAGKAVVGQLQAQQTSMAVEQHATLEAVTALADALAKDIEAGQTLEPEDEEAAAEAARQAQLKAAQAEKTMAATPAARATADRKIQAAKMKKKKKKDDQ